MSPTADQAGVARATALFQKAFSCLPTIAVAAPGRVNLIGEHVDYNEGFVFPLALEKNTYIVACPLPDDTQCHVVAGAFSDEPFSFTPGDTPFSPDTPGWVKYVKGMTAIYARNGHNIVPFRAVIVSDVPMGGGLSSSASLEMATGVLIEQLAGLQVDPADRAKMGQKCEHEFAGVPCGIMDQLISSKGQTGYALLIDCRSLDVKAVPLNDPNVVIVIADSNNKHELSGSEYPTRRAQCEDAAAKMAAKFPDKNVTHLRDCDMGMLQAVTGELDAETEKRARHAIQEDIRTLEAKKCLENGDLVRTGKLMHESHVSLRDLFEVSTPEIDALVDIAMGVDGVYGSRITGGGFGGCTVTLVAKNSVEALMQAFEEQYPQHNQNKEATVFATLAGDGARAVTELIPSA